MDLLPLSFLQAVAKVMGMGADKYGKFNYKLGHVNTDLTAAMLRHIKQYEEGQSNDPESGVSHIAHVAANCLMLIEQEHIRTSVEGRYIPPAKTKDVPGSKL